MQSKFLSSLILVASSAFTVANTTDADLSAPLVADDATTINVPAEAAVTATVIDTYTCHHRERVRIIQVLNYHGADVVCEVSYENASDKKILWDAKWSTDFCQNKARQFAVKQVGWGWRCTDTYGVNVEIEASQPVSAEGLQ